MKVQENKQFRINSRDFWMGLLQAVGVVVLTWLLDATKEGMGYDWPMLIDAAIAAALTYLGRNFLEPTKTVVISENPIEAKMLAQQAQAQQKHR